MKQHYDLRSAGVLLLATIIGVAWATYHYLGTGGERTEAHLRSLIWTIFATPCALFIGWTIARRAEVWTAAFVCFCVYFFTPFVAARIESLFLTMEEAQQQGHPIYFPTVIMLHGICGIAIAIWRARSPATAATSHPATAPPLSS